MVKSVQPLTEGPHASYNILQTRSTPVVDRSHLGDSSDPGGAASTAMGGAGARYSAHSACALDHDRRVVRRVRLRLVEHSPEFTRGRIFFITSIPFVPRCRAG